MESFFEAFFAGEVGPVTNREEWPRPLKRLVDSAEESGIEVQRLQVYCLANGLSIEYVWRMKSTVGLLELISQDYALKDYSPPESGRFQAQDYLPDWWDPQEHADTHYYAGKLGGTGDQFVVFHDESNHTIFVHYYENW